LSRISGSCPEPWHALQAALEHDPQHAVAHDRAYARLCVRASRSSTTPRGRSRGVSPPATTSRNSGASWYAAGAAHGDVLVAQARQDVVGGGDALAEQRGDLVGAHAVGRPASSQVTRSASSRCSARDGEHAWH
jgi:hypothetical protein